MSLSWTAPVETKCCCTCCLTSAELCWRTTPLYLLSVLLPTQPSMELVLISTRLRCRLMCNVLSAGTPQSFSVELLFFPAGACAAGLGICFSWISWGFCQIPLPVSAECFILCSTQIFRHLCRKGKINFISFSWPLMFLCVLFPL